MSALSSSLRWPFWESYSAHQVVATYRLRTSIVASLSLASPLCLGSLLAFHAWVFPLKTKNTSKFIIKVIVRKIIMYLKLTTHLSFFLYNSKRMKLVSCPCLSYWVLFKDRHCTRSDAVSTFQQFSLEANHGSATRIVIKVDGKNWHFTTQACL